MTGVSHTTEVRRLELAMSRERRAIALLHTTQLPESDLCALGREFLERFYYGVLLEDPRYFCYVYMVDGAVAGFTAFSSETTGVIRGGVLRSWLLLAWVIAKLVLRHPTRLLKLLKIAASFVALGAEEYSEIPAEVMSTAVDPRYRSLDFHRRTGINVARTLYENTALSLADRGVKQVKGFTRRSNHLVHAAISSLGWRKVYEGWHRRGTRHEETCIWLWDVDEAAQRFRTERATRPS